MREPVFSKSDLHISGFFARGKPNLMLFEKCRKIRIEPSALPHGEVPVDIDVTPVTPFDNSKTKKEVVPRTYKGFDGYAPIMVYIGSEGFLVNTELREGRQHCQIGISIIISLSGNYTNERGGMSGAF